jgi:hypothetical protein
VISGSNALSASYSISASNALAAQTASFVQNAQSASYVLTAQTASFVANAQSASNAVAAQTASFANAFTVAGTLTAQTLVVQTITSSVDFVTGSTRFGSVIGNTHIFTGSVSITGSLALVGNITSNGTAVVLGSGTTNYLPKFTSGSTIGNSLVYDSGTGVVIGGAATTNGFLEVIKSGGSIAQFSFGQSTTYRTDFFVDATGTFYIQPQGTTRLTLTDSGNLGLGVTPSAWDNSVFRVIQIGSSIPAFLAGRTDSFANVQLGVNAFFDGSWKYVGNDFATRYFQTAGGHAWQIAPSGTAGNAISFTQAMTLNASGNLSIGNTNDTYKLDVSGTGRFTQFLYLNSASNTAGAQGLLFYNSGPNTGSRSWRLSNDQINWGDFAIQVSTTQTGSTYITPLNIASTGAATFSSNVGINGAGTSFPLLVKVATNQNVRISSETSTSIQAVNDAANAFVTLKLDGSSLLLNSQSGGNVGIGTTSPTDSIIGSGTFLDIAGTGGGALKLHFTNATAYGEFSFYKGSNGSYIDSAGAATVGNNDLIFRTGGTSNNYGVSERMRITSGGVVCLNTTSIRTTGWTTGVAGSLCSEMLNYGGGQWFVNVNNDEGAYLVLGKTRGTTINANNIVQNNDTLGAIIFQGADGSAVQSGARIIGKVDGTPGASDMPGRLEFHTTADGSTNPTERMRIFANGNIAIQDTFVDNGSKLNISSGAKGGIRIITNSTYDAISIGGTGSLKIDYPGVGGGRFELNDAGTLFLRQYSNGTLSISSGQVVSSSDINLKNDNGGIENALSKVLKLNPRYFYWKKDSGIETTERQLGFYAQEVQESLGIEVANKNSNEKWGIYDRGIIAMLTKAMQEQQEQINELKSQLNK